MSLILFSLPLVRGRSHQRYTPVGLSPLCGEHSWHTPALCSRRQNPRRDRSEPAYLLRSLRARKGGLSKRLLGSVPRARRSRTQYREIVLRAITHNLMIRRIEILYRAESFQSAKHLSRPLHTEWARNSPIRTAAVRSRIHSITIADGASSLWIYDSAGENRQRSAAEVPRRW